KEKEGDGPQVILVEFYIHLHTKKSFKRLSVPLLGPEGGIVPFGSKFRIMGPNLLASLADRYWSPRRVACRMLQHA
ncbi:unnamed protein product, partial [Dovyalis caffra]